MCDQMHTKIKTMWVLENWIGLEDNQKEIGIWKTFAKQGSVHHLLGNKTNIIIHI